MTQMCLPSRQVIGEKSRQDVRERGMEAEGADVAHPQGLNSNKPCAMERHLMKRRFLFRFVVRFVAAQQLNETESGHATSQIPLLGSSPLEPSVDGVCSLTVVDI